MACVVCARRNASMEGGNNSTCVFGFPRVERFFARLHLFHWVFSTGVPDANLQISPFHMTWHLSLQGTKGNLRAFCIFFPRLMSRRIDPHQPRFELHSPTVPITLPRPPSVRFQAICPALVAAASFFAPASSTPMVAPLCRTSCSLQSSSTVFPAFCACRGSVWGGERRDGWFMRAQGAT